MPPPFSNSRWPQSTTAVLTINLEVSSFTRHYIVVAFNFILLPGCGSVVDMPSMQERVGPGSGYRARLSGGHRAEEAVDMLKLFYDGQNPNAPNPKVKGVRVNRIVEDVIRDPASGSSSGR